MPLALFLFVAVIRTSPLIESEACGECNVNGRFSDSGAIGMRAGPVWHENCYGRDPLPVSRIGAKTMAGSRSLGAVRALSPAAA
jgi:hypothetical protein